MPLCKARHACQACRRLKRKCDRQLPSCSLCTRLGKPCDYPGGATPLAYQSSHSEKPLNLLSFLEGLDQLFPLAFFLDTNLFSPGPASTLTSGPRPLLQQIVSEHIPIDERSYVLETYFSTIHSWLPMISKKQLMHTGSDSCFDPLLLCMKVCITPLTGLSPAKESLYVLAKTLCSAAEDAGLASLRLVQSHILLAVYEASHAIYPTAYTTIGRAARLAFLMGWHDREAQQLFRQADAWSSREEQRRTWWALYILDKFITIDVHGLPFAAPQLCHDELLPVSDEDWNRGRAFPSAPLYTTSFSPVASLGPFARACQAAHMLSKVVQHKEAKNRALQNDADLLEEARSLHQALSALQLSIEESVTDGSSESYDPTLSAPIAICVCARQVLHGLYGCPDAAGSVNRERSALETEMQLLSIHALRILASSTGPKLARLSSECPLLARSLYSIAKACAWFVREDHELEMQNALRCTIDRLRHLSKRWKAAGEYLLLLEQGGVFGLVILELNLSNAVVKPNY